MTLSCDRQRSNFSNGPPTAVTRRLAPQTADTGSDRPLIIPVFLPHLGCPHHCAFCNQRAITRHDAVLPSPNRLQQMVETYLAYSGKRRNCTQVAFFGGNFLGLDPVVIRSLLSVAERFVTSGAVDGIRFSTRPDTIDSRRLELIEPFSIRTVELGVQSMQNEVLKRSVRGHSAQDTVTAVQRLKQRPYEIGLQLMIGLPGESEAGCFQSAGKVAELRPDIVRLYPAVVLAGSQMAAWYKAGEYTPLSLPDGIKRVKQLVLFFSRQGVRIARMGLQVTDSQGLADRILAGPFHPAFGHLVHCELFFDMARRLVDCSHGDFSTVTFDVHPRSESRMRGLHNENLVRLRKEFAVSDLQTRSDPQLPVDALRLAQTGKMLTYADLQCDI